MNNKTTAPLARLTAERSRIRRQCRQQEQELDQDWEYIQQHAGSLLLSGLASVLLSGFGSKEKEEEDTQEGRKSSPNPFSGIEAMLPVIWEIAKPLLISWGMSKIRTWIQNFMQK